MRRPQRILTRLLSWQLAFVVGLLVAIGVIWDRSQLGTVLLPCLLVACGIAAVSAAMATRDLVRPLGRVVATLERMRSGDRSVRADEGGPAEIVSLGAAINAMADQVERETAAAEDGASVRDLVLSSMQEGIALFAPDGTVAFANGSMAHLLGGFPVDTGALAPSRLRDGVAAAMAGTPQELSFDTGVPLRWLEGSAAPVDGGGVLLVLRDVTMERRVDAVRRDFVANASHELKTPAATIQATAETIRIAAEDDPASVPRFAERLEQEAFRLSRIVADLLDLSRLESGEGYEEPLPLDEVVREEGDRARTQAEVAAVTLALDTVPVAVVGSRNDLGLLVRNLLTNAVNYSQEGGTVSVTLERRDGLAILTVRDDGIGIPGRDLDRIFERFYRVDRARSRETGGTGLGLSIVRHVAENHGGSVSVASELGVGSTFTVRLPAAD